MSALSGKPEVGIGQPDFSNPNSENIVGRCRRLPTGERTGLNELHSWLALAAVLDPYRRFVIDCCASFSRELSMKKITLVGLAILAVSISPALAKGKAKPKAAAATSTASAMPVIGQVSAADRALYKKNKHDSGVK
jgi:hypothetical protein